ncbi:MAG: FAD-dependent oxidoreductase [Lachnospiraceae bacterium]|nr:FAD-dependent oxidoreductase [Lachnospiraceae bacterium]
MESIWSKETKINDRESFIGNGKAEVVVIGAGMAGLLVARSLKKYGLDVVVLEADKIGSGQTKNTTAKITSQHGLFYDKLIKKVGKEKAERYAIANQKAISEYQRIIEEENIECDFERLPAYLYSTDLSENEGIEKLQNEVRAANSLGIRAELEKECELPFKVNGVLKFGGQAQFNPLKFIEHISKDLTIYENSRVLCVKDHMVYTERGDIWGDNIVFATHYPFVNVPGLYFLRQHQERSYVLALENTQKLNGMYYGIEENGLSFRSSKDLLLLGGAGHRTGNNEKFIKENECKCGQKLGIYDYLRNQAKEFYPNCKEVTHWSAQDCVTHDEIPFIGRYSYLRPYWYVATGFKKWGMTSSMVSAMIISDEIIGNISPYSEVFTPQRLNMKASYKNLIKDMGISIIGLSKGHFTNKTPKCKHLGCALSWNEDEKTWECPCHGSRFDKDGKLIDDPAQTDLEI